MENEIIKIMKLEKAVKLCLEYFELEISDDETTRDDSAFSEAYYACKDAIEIDEDAIAVNQALKAIEVRIISHTPNPMGYRVALIFDNGTTSPCTKDFPTYEAAQFFVDGLRDGLQWQAMLIEAGIASAARFQEENAMQPLDAEDFIAMIRRDYFRKESYHEDLPVL
jgi:hypothetical protein